MLMIFPLLMDILAQDGAQIVTLPKPLIYREYFELNIKLTKVRMKAKKVVITFVVIAVFVKFS